MRLLALAAVALVAAAGCGGDGSSGAENRPLRRTAERIVVFDDHSAAVVGIAASGRSDSSGGCRPGRGETWDFFATRISRDGKVARTDLIEEKDLEGCGADGSTGHDAASAALLSDYGPTAYAQTGIPGGGAAVMHARGYQSAPRSRCGRTPGSSSPAASRRGAARCGCCGPTAGWTRASGGRASSHADSVSRRSTCRSTSCGQRRELPAASGKFVPAR